jgi:patatin-like phospholipase/acyl hydrolase
LAHGEVDAQNAVDSTYIFRSYDHYPPSSLASRKTKAKHRNPGNAHPDEIYKIALATSAAPRYFPKVVINDHEYRDGAMGANNPAEIALNEVMQMHEQLPRIVVSIGTGDRDRRVKKAKKTGLIKDWHNVAKVLTQLATESAETASRVEERCKEQGILHWRY